MAHRLALHYGLVADVQRGRLVGAAVGLAVAAVLAGACSNSSGAATAADQAFLAELHGADPGINSVRNDTQLVRLGHAVCDDFRARASYEQVADRLLTEAGTGGLQSQDLGAVITAAADNYCPQYRALVS